MTLTRFSLAFLAALLPALAYSAVPTVQDANQSFRQGKNQLALEKVTAYLTANPKDAQGRFLKGLVLTEMNRYADAIKVFSSLTEDYPELPEPYNNLAVLYAAQADYERAKNSLEMAIRTHPSYATAHENLGDIYAKMASQAYDKALQLDKSNTSAQTKLSLIRDLFSPTPRATETAKSSDSGKAKTKPAAKPATQEAAKAPEVIAAASSPAAEPTNSGKDAAKQATEAIDPNAQIERTVNAWAEAWSARDVDTYLSFYSDQFKVPEGGSRSDWAQERRMRVTRPKFIKVSIDQLKIALDGNTAQASFNQKYVSNTYRDSGNKTLDLVREGTNWKIIEEQ